MNGGAGQERPVIRAQPHRDGADLVEVGVDLAVDLGFPVRTVSPDRAGAADVSWLAGKVGMILDAVGLKGHDEHSVNETADLSTLPVQTKRAAVLLRRLARGIPGD